MGSTFATSMPGCNVAVLHDLVTFTHDILVVSGPCFVVQITVLRTCSGVELSSLAPSARWMLLDHVTHGCHGVSAGNTAFR